MHSRSLIEAIASTIQARANCICSQNVEWQERHETTLEDLASERLPSGSGFDSGTTIDLDRSRPGRIVLSTSYHHMIEGSYDGWTEHDVIVTPSFIGGFDVRITGRNRSDIKEYIGDVFYEALGEDLPQATGDLLEFAEREDLPSEA